MTFFRQKWPGPPHGRSVQCRCGDQAQILPGFTLAARIRPMMIYEYCRLMKLPMLSRHFLIGAMNFKINYAICLAPITMPTQRMVPPLHSISGLFKDGMFCRSMFQINIQKPFFHTHTYSGATHSCWDAFFFSFCQKELFDLGGMIFFVGIQNV